MELVFDIEKCGGLPALVKLPSMSVIPSCDVPAAAGTINEGPEGFFAPMPPLSLGGGGGGAGTGVVIMEGYLIDNLPFCGPFGTPASQARFVVYSGAGGEWTSTGTIETGVSRDPTLTGSVGAKVVAFRNTDGELHFLWVGCSPVV